MDSSRESEFDARLARIEESIAALQGSIDALIAERTPRYSQEQHADAPGDKRRGSYAPRVPPLSGAPPSSTPPIAPRRREKMADDIGDNLTAWFSSRSAEWWLSRLGIGFVILAVLLLYGYAIDKGWITPPIRVFAGVAVGAVLFWAAIRVRAEAEPSGASDLGFRELLFGGALAIWYVTANAAAVWYQLIPIPVARLAFFVLGIVSTWIALQERREIFAFVAVATGFATPFILPAPLHSMTELSFYLGAVAAIGLMIYLMRGWPSVIWITFLAFWPSIATRIYSLGTVNLTAVESVALSLLLVAAGAAFTRSPLLRRQLVLLGSERYAAAPVTTGTKRFMEAMDSLARALGGGKSAPDSLVVWFMTLVSAIVAINFLGDVWTSVPPEVWGVAFVVLGAGALALYRRGSQPDPEIAHVELTAAVLWTITGIERVAPTPENLPLCSAAAALAAYSIARGLAGPRLVAKLTIVLALLTIVGRELSLMDTGIVHLRWVLSEVATLVCAAIIARTLVAESAEEMQEGLVLAVAGYLIALLVIADALAPVWNPLVSASYAVLGAVLLILSRRPGSHRLLRHLGGATMVIVVARLLLVDLSTVETIWRVLLFLVCGAVFLYTGYRMQPTRAPSNEK